ncbi:signal peptidase I [Patescibacteria group bacterium]|nr:signal peptidase I [Patescibacteria group bacterium]
MSQEEHLEKEGSLEENSLEGQDFDLSHFSENDEEPSISWAKKFAILIFEVVKVVLISLAIILPIRLFLVQPFYVEGASMEPNFYQNEYLVIDEISYRFNSPQRGEVIILKDPRNTRAYFIKRVIGLPGEEVELKAGRVYINDKILEESYIANFSSDDHPKITLGLDEYFAMGDNRVNSLDSRQLGPIQKSGIVGRVWFRGWPLDRLNTFNLPSY